MVVTMFAFTSTSAKRSPSPVSAAWAATTWFAEGPLAGSDEQPVKIPAATVIVAILDRSQIAAALEVKHMLAFIAALRM